MTLSTPNVNLFFYGKYDILYIYTFRKGFSFMEPKYAFIDQNPVNGYLRVRDKNGLWGLINAKTKREVIPCKYKYLSVPYSDGYCFAGSTLEEFYYNRVRVSR